MIANENLRCKFNTLYDFLSCMENDHMSIELVTKSNIGGKKVNNTLGVYVYEKDKKSSLKPVEDEKFECVFDEVDTVKFLVTDFKIHSESYLTITIKDNPTQVLREPTEKVKEVGQTIQQTAKRGVEAARAAFTQNTK